MPLDIIVNERDPKKYFWAKYYIESNSDLVDAAMELAIGQSIGNPNARSKWETKDMITNHCAKIFNGYGYPQSKGGHVESHQFSHKKSGEREGFVWIGFPYANINWETDGIAQLMCFLMGGQLDITNIKKCQLLDLQIDQSKTYFQGPKFGLTGLRNMSGSFNKPLFGGIVKPKTGLKPSELLELVKELLDGGVDFIKEDEILGDPTICPFHERVSLITEFIVNHDYKAVYTFCINGDPMSVINKARLVQSYNLQNVGVHANVWSGLGVYKDIREIGVFQHFQKSGDKIFTNTSHDFHISWNVICKLAGLAGVDTIHAGMLGGYSNDDEKEMLVAIKTLRDANVCPALSCGMTAEIVPQIVAKIGNDWMANSGGAIHSDPKGTQAGAMKIRNAIDRR